MKGRKFLKEALKGSGAEYAIKEFSPNIDGEYQVNIYIGEYIFTGCSTDDREVYLNALSSIFRRFRKEDDKDVDKFSDTSFNKGALWQQFREETSLVHMTPESAQLEYQMWLENKILKANGSTT